MTMKHKSLNQLLCAATVNGRFCDTLLSDPARAIASGYFGHSFSLTPDERDFVVGIQAQRLEDFAAQVYQWISGNAHAHNAHGQSVNGHNGNGHNGNGHNGNGQNGNGHNGNGHIHDLFGSTDKLVDLYRAPVPVHAF